MKMTERMMTMKKNIVLATSGSRGDVQPMVALALRLREAGHTVKLCAPPNFKGWADHLELPFASVSIDMKALLVLHREKIARPFALATKLGGTLRDDINLQFATLPAALGSGRDEWNDQRRITTFSAPRRSASITMPSTRAS